MDEQRHTILKAVLFCLIVIVVIIIVMIVDPHGAARKVQQVVQATKLPDDVAKEKADKQLTAENTRLAQSNQKLTQELADVTKEKEVALSDKVQAIQENISIKKDNAALSEANGELSDDNSKLNDEIENRPRYQKLYKQETNWHLSLGGMITVPINDPEGTTVHALLSLGPPKWQVLTGVGWSPEAGLSVSCGFMYSFGHPKAP